MPEQHIHVVGDSWKCLLCHAEPVVELVPGSGIYQCWSCNYGNRTPNTLSSIHIWPDRLREDSCFLCKAVSMQAMAMSARIWYRPGKHATTPYTIQNARGWMCPRCGMVDWKWEKEGRLGKEGLKVYQEALPRVPPPVVTSAGARQWLTSASRR